MFAIVSSRILTVDMSEIGVFQADFFWIAMVVSYVATIVVICNVNDFKSWYSLPYLMTHWIFYMSFLN